MNSGPRGVSCRLSFEIGIRERRRSLTIIRQSNVPKERPLLREIAPGSPPPARPLPERSATQANAHREITAARPDAGRTGQGQRQLGEQYDTGYSRSRSRKIVSERGKQTLAPTVTIRARPDELVCMDSSLEGDGFELSVPRDRLRFKALSLVGRLVVWRRCAEPVRNRFRCPITKVFRAASELGRSILAAGQPSSCRPRTDRGSKGPFKEPQSTQPWRREPLFMPHTCRSQYPSGSAQQGRKLSFIPPPMVGRCRRGTSPSIFSTNPDSVQKVLQIPLSVNR